MARTARLCIVRVYYQRVVVVLQVRVYAVDRINIVRVQALVHGVAKGNFGRLVAVVVEKHQVHQRNEEREVEQVREIDQTIALLGVCQR